MQAVTTDIWPSPSRVLSFTSEVSRNPLAGVKESSSCCRQVALKAGDGALQPDHFLPATQIHLRLWLCRWIEPPNSRTSGPTPSKCVLQRVASHVCVFQPLRIWT
mmetsp:Transcript_95906/g.143613  ORF Transcript_95906/g.143613 Transcript_95906/m.143613 type:complete len:105 (+) Transcript_95906:437-751(+)